MKKIGPSIERQIINSYKQGLKDFLKSSGMYFKKVDNYLRVFDKCFNTTNIGTYKNMKIPQIKSVIDQFAKSKSIDLNDF